MKYLSIASAIVGIALALPLSLSADPSTHSDNQQADIKARESILDELDAASGQLRELLPSPDIMVDETKRKHAAPKVLPILHHMQALMAKLEQDSDPADKTLAKRLKMRLLPMLALFRDDTANTQIEKLADSSDREESLSGSGGRLMLRWINASHDPAAQQKLLGDAKSLTKTYPTSDRLTDLLDELSQTAASSDSLADQMQDLAAAMRTLRAARVRMAVEARDKLRELEGKPLILKAVQFDGRPFSSDDWKGKVILVDFWSTGCAPCIAEMPQVKELYDKYHDKGLEVIGVSCDEEPAALERFLHANDKEMPWPQLYDIHHPGWHALAVQYGVESTPAMFLIDRKGIVRSTRAQNNFATTVAKLLDEPAK